MSHHEQTANITASYLSDALGDLLLALWTLAEGDIDARCSWHEEPGEYRWLLSRRGDIVEVRVLWFDELWGDGRDNEGRAVFQSSSPVRCFVRAVTRGAAAVQQEHGNVGYRTKWVEHDFPSDTLALLTDWLDDAGKPPPPG